MMRNAEPNEQWKKLGVDRVVQLELCDLSDLSLSRLEILGYKIGAVINLGKGQIMVIQLPGDEQDKQIGVSVLELEDILKEICHRNENAHKL